MNLVDKILQLYRLGATAPYFSVERESLWYWPCNHYLIALIIIIPQRFFQAVTAAKIHGDVVDIAVTSIIIGTAVENQVSRS